MNFSKLKDAANKLLEFMEKYDLNNYNEIVGLYPPRGGLTEMYVADEDREKMNKINRELKELKKKITLLD